MKQYYITSNVNDRNATAKSLANGEKFDVWFTPSTVRHYDEQGDLICTECCARRIPAICTAAR